jgi:hypothetical protein
MERLAARWNGQNAGSDDGGCGGGGAGLRPEMKSAIEGSGVEQALADDVLKPAERPQGPWDATRTSLPTSGDHAAGAL